MSCEFGRKYDPNHRTCISCEKQMGPCKKKPKKRRAEDMPVRTWHEGDTLITTQYFKSLNHWHGAPKAVYFNYRSKWKQVISGTIHLWGRADKKRRLVIERIVTKENQLIKDTVDNLNGGMKPIKDLLVKEGVLIDDEDQYVEASITQRIGPEQQVRITITDI